ncbi:MAG TPA: MarR family transcriptional regulator [Nocardioidaceae bacterium]|nr:MarR family transcriptional regulator [Nocardioidaceae bacterium]
MTTAKPEIESVIHEMVRLKRLIHRLGQAPHDAPRARSANWLLFAVRHRGSIRLADLAAACYIDASTASRQTAELVAQGLLRRESDPADGRVSLLTLTDEGEQVVQELIEQRKAFFGSALADWDYDDVRQLAVLMGRLTDALDAQADRPETFDSRKVTA